MSLPFQKFEKSLGSFVDFDICDFVDVSEIKNITTNFISDSPCELHFIFSHDGIKDAVALKYATGVDNWKNVTIECIFPFLRVHIVNKSQGPNNNFVLCCIPQYRKKHSDIIVQPTAPLPPPLVTPSLPVSKSCEDLVEESKPPSRDSTPKKLRSFFKKKEEVSTLRESQELPRLPEIVSDGCLFIGNKFGKIVCLHKGTPGQLLSVLPDGSIGWIDPPA